MVMDRLRRWFVFNAVGLAGFVVQLATLAALVRVVRLHHLVATAIAVEAAVLHNFWWHQRVTWPDRPGVSRRTGLRRLARFHLLNGAISVTATSGSSGLSPHGATWIPSVPTSWRS